MEQATMNVLEARGLVKEYKRTRAVAGVSLAVGPGERVALLGANGAGKTTTLLMLLGAITPDEGEVTVLGHRLPAGRSRAMEVLGYFANLHGVVDPAPAIEAGLERFRISHLADAMAGELSSGQRTLVGIIKATLHRPRLLVLDEPTASLDPDVAHRVRVGLEETCEAFGSALLVTSHNMTDVERICERVVFLSHGVVVADGPPAEVARQF